MVKSQGKKAELIDYLGGSNADYIQMLCFTIPVHELAFVVEAVSAPANEATTEMAPFDMAIAGIRCGVQQLFESEVDTNAWMLGQHKIETPGQLVDCLNDRASIMEDNKFSVNIEHMQQVFELNAHQEKFSNRMKDTRAVYSALCNQLVELLAPACAR